MADGSGVSETGLELHLKMEDNYDDDSANNNDQSPQITLPDFVTDGAVDKGAELDPNKGHWIDTGAGDVGDASLFANSGEAWTASAWVRRYAGTHLKGSVIARRISRAADDVVFDLQIRGGGQPFIILNLRGAATTYLFLDSRDGDWHHLAVTWDGTDAVFYIDGAAQATAPSVGVLTELATANTTIGHIDAQVFDSITNNTHAFRGGIDQLRIYSRALTAGEILLLAAEGGAADAGGVGVVPEDLELLLGFEEDLSDSSIHGRDQDDNLTTVDTGSLTYVNDGQINKASAWAGSDGDIYIDTGVTEFGDASLFAGAGEAWSVSFWSRFPSTENGGVVVAKGDANASNHIFAVWLLPNTDQVRVYLRTGTSSNYTLTLDGNDWHHHVVTWDGSTAKYYFDGNAQANPSVGSTADNGNIIIGAIRDTNGATPDYNVAFTGEMDDLRIYSRAITADEVDDLFENATPPFSATLSLTSIDDAVASLQVVFAESVTGFAAGDVTVTNGSVSNVAGSGTTWTFDVTATADGTVTAKVNASAVTDSNGVANAESNLVSWGVGGVADPSTAGIVRFDRSASQTGQTGNIVMGPIMISPNASEKSVIQRMIVSLGSGTSATGTLKVATGIDGEDAVNRANNDAHQFSTTITGLQNNNGVCFPRVAGHAAVIEIDVTSGNVVLEQINLQLKPAGRNRGGRYSA